MGHWKILDCNLTSIEIVIKALINAKKELDNEYKSGNKIIEFYDDDIICLYGTFILTLQQYIRRTAFDIIEGYNLSGITEHILFNNYSRKINNQYQTSVIDLIHAMGNFYKHFEEIDRQSDIKAFRFPGKNTMNVLIETGLFDKDNLNDIDSYSDGYRPILNGINLINDKNDLKNIFEEVVEWRNKTWEFYDTARDKK